MKINSKNKINLLLFSILLLATIGLFLIYAFTYKYHFFKQEQNQIFLNSSDWILTYFEKAGWLARLWGDWLTQFYYYLFAGPAILSINIALTSAAAYYFTKNLTPQWVSIIVSSFVFLWLAFASFSSTCLLSSILIITGWLITLCIFKPLRWWGLALSIVLSIWLFGLGPIPIPSLPNWEYEKRLAIENEYYFDNYDKTIYLAHEFEKPNIVTSFYYYLAQARKGNLADSLLCYPVKDLGTLTKISDKSPLSVINMMNELYYVLGDMTYAERAAMMNNVFSPQNRNVRMIKRLAEINLISADTLAALKYLRILSKTYAYKNWALNHMPESMSSQTEKRINIKKQLINQQNTIRIGDNCRTILIELLESNFNNLVALDYLLCTDLLLKDLDNFKSDYDNYCFNIGKPRLKVLYQQALMIYLAGTTASEEEWEKYIFDYDQMERFKKYNQSRGNPQFADTYWYYFDTHK